MMDRRIQWRICQRRVADSKTRPLAAIRRTDAQSVREVEQMERATAHLKPSGGPLSKNSPVQLRSLPSACVPMSSRRHFATRFVLFLFFPTERIGLSHRLVTGNGVFLFRGKSHSRLPDSAGQRRPQDFS